MENDQIKNLLTHIVTHKYDSAKENLNNVLSQLAYNKINDYKPKVAKKYFNNNSEE